METEEYTIKWSKPVPINFKDDGDGPIEFNPRESCWNGDGFYVIYVVCAEAFNNMITMNEKLLYIGQAYEQSIEKRVGQEHPFYDKIRNILKNQFNGAFVQAGIIDNCPKKSQELYDDIEALLIYTNYQKEPTLNTMNKDSYDGRSLIIKNDGCNQIKKISRSPDLTVGK